MDCTNDISVFGIDTKTGHVVGRTKTSTEESTMNIEIKEVRDLESAAKEDPSLSKAIMHVGDGLFAIAYALTRPHTYPTDDKIDDLLKRNA